MKTNALRTRLLLAALAAVTPACATLGTLSGMIQAPRISSADDRRAELRLSSGFGRSALGATLRVYARVRNPNPFGITLSTLRGDLFLEGQRAADVDLPLGLRLAARDETEIPIDLTVPLEGVPSLARTLARAATGSPVAYRVDGTMGVKAGDVGEPVFGPLTLLEGHVQVR